MTPKKPYSPLRYPGGKAKFAPLVASIMEANNITNGHYLEPYAGGAAVALELLFHGYASHIHINDADPAIYDFWFSITRKTEKFLRLLHDTPINMEQWFYWKSILRGERDASQVERGFATFFMNRTNRSGILNGGVIGGKGQAGEYQLDARFNKSALSQRIECVAKRASDISVYCEDALSLLKQCKKLLPKTSIIYLDPPYYVKGQGLYRNYYKHDNHVAIANTLQKSSFGRRWIVSYDNVEQIKEMYKLSRSLQYALNYTAQVKYVGSEIMFFRSDLSMPDAEEFQSQELVA